MKQRIALFAASILFATAAHAWQVKGPDGTTQMKITDDGKVGVGIATPGAKLDVAGQVKITGGSPGAGKVLTSDANGLASWQAASGGGGIRICAETQQCTGTVLLCSGNSPDSSAVLTPVGGINVTYGSWSNSQCGTSGTGWHVTAFSSCSTGVGSAIARCAWVMVQQ